MRLGLRTPLQCKRILGICCDTRAVSYRVFALCEIKDGPSGSRRGCTAPIACAAIADVPPRPTHIGPQEQLLAWPGMGPQHLQHAGVQFGVGGRYEVWIPEIKRIAPPRRDDTARFANQ